MNSASYYLDRAEDARAEAQKATREEIKKQFIAIAEQYEALAHMVAQTRKA